MQLHLHCQLLHHYVSLHQCFLHAHQYQHHCLHQLPSLTFPPTQSRVSVPLQISTDTNSPHDDSATTEPNSLLVWIHNRQPPTQHCSQATYHLVKSKMYLLVHPVSNDLQRNMNLNQESGFNLPPSNWRGMESNELFWTYIILR